MFEGKKIGRAKNLEKLREEIDTQDGIVADLKARIQTRHNEVIGFNEQLKENAIREAQEDIQRLANQVFALAHKMENLHQQEQTGLQRIEELEIQLQENHDAISSTRESLDALNHSLAELATRAEAVELQYNEAEQLYSLAQQQYNEQNLQFTRQQSKLMSLKQEFEFKNNQMADLSTKWRTAVCNLKMPWRILKAPLLHCNKRPKHWSTC